MKFNKSLLFLAGTVFGSLGFKILASKEAKRLYTKGTALGLKSYDEVMKTVQKIQSEAEDILDNARQMNEKEKEQENIKEAEF